MGIYILTLQPRSFVSSSSVVDRPPHPCSFYVSFQFLSHDLMWISKQTTCSNVEQTVEMCALKQAVIAELARTIAVHSVTD